jgi:hypothetical protein
MDSNGQMRSNMPQSCVSGSTAGLQFCIMAVVVVDGNGLLWHFFSIKGLWWHMGLRLRGSIDLFSFGIFHLSLLLFHG